ncbi:MAG: lipoate protein ligase C-terminal domain-containing protein [Candidatus Diapherotrites archaeon]
MIKKSVYKIPEGKLVKISLDFENNVINSVKITGDFFLHPENGLELIESSLKGIELEKEKIIESIDVVVKQNSLELFGLTSEGIAEAILMAKESKNELEN